MDGRMSYCLEVIFQSTYLNVGTELAQIQTFHYVCYVFIYNLEQQILQEYEEGIYHEEALLESTVKSHESETVICPVCQK